MRNASIGSILLLALSAAPAQAHAILVESTPAIGAALAGGTINLSLRFNSRIDAARSLLTLIRPDRSTLVITKDPSGAEDVLAAHGTLPPGAYIVRWQVLAVDGHITRGDVGFTVLPPMVGR